MLMFSAAATLKGEGGVAEAATALGSVAAPAAGRMRMQWLRWEMMLLLQLALHGPPLHPLCSLLFPQQIQTIGILLSSLTHILLNIFLICIG